MKSINKSLLILSLLITIITPQKITPINLTKLTLKSATITNNTDADQEIKINYQKKCPGCPRLHEKYSKKITLTPSETKTIKEEPHIIKNITPLNTTKAINLTSHNPEEASVTLSLDDTKKQDFPKIVDFDEVLKRDEHYDMMTRGHDDYNKGLPEGVTHEQYFKKLKDLYTKNIKLMRRSSKKTSRPGDLQKSSGSRDPLILPARHSLGDVGSESRSDLYRRTKKSKIKIPKKLHVAWFGGHPMPEQFKKWQEEWKAKHPGWTFTFWNEDKVKKSLPKLHNQTIFDEARMMYDYATMSKVVRYEILKKFGGVYIDPDMKCWESLEPLVNNYHFFAGVGRFYKTFGVCDNSVIGSCPHHPILRSAIEYIKSCETKPGGLYDWTAKNLSQYPLTKAVYEQAGKKAYYTDIILPRSYFDGNDVEKEFNHTEVPYQAFYEHIQHRPEAFCSRGVWSYVADK